MFINFVVNNLQHPILVVLDIKHEQHPVQRTYLVPYKVLWAGFYQQLFFFQQQCFWTFIPKINDNKNAFQ